MKFEHIHRAYMRITEILKKFNEIFSILSYWGFETSAFILLPLFIYVIIFLSLNLPLSHLFGLPEWMFIAIILYGDTLNRSIIFYKDFKGFAQKAAYIISWAILWISVSSVLLAFSIIAEYKEFEMASFYYTFQTIIFLMALITSASSRLFIVGVKKEAKLYTHLIPDTENMQRDT